MRANQFSSHQSDPLAAAAALAVMEIIETEGLVDRAAAAGKYMWERIEGVAERCPKLTNLRGRGLMIGFDVFWDPAKRTVEAEAGSAVEHFCRSRCVHFQAIQGNRFRILPPLTITNEEIDRFVEVLEESLGALVAGAAPEPARNPRVREYESRSRRGWRHTLKWAWSHSPSAWFDKLGARVR